MSSFQLNLAFLTLSAKERLARLEASSGALHARLLSPDAGAPLRPALAVGSSLEGSSPPSLGSSPSPSPAGVGSLLLVGSDVGERGLIGESLFPRGATGGLSAFIMTPEFFTSLCCGAVAGGVKFCMLGAQTCTFTTHAKKVSPLLNHIYISTG
jgi:hypothetical protein